MKVRSSAYDGHPSDLLRIIPLIAGIDPKLTVPWIDLNGDFAAIVVIPINANGEPKASRFMKQAPFAYSLQLYG